MSALDLRFGVGRRLPVILQTEAAECGLACLAMVACHWGHRVDLAWLRRRFAISLKGSTLKSLIAMAEALELRARPLRLELEHLPELALPCVIHWDMTHFVVLRSVGRARVVIHDPAVGERRVALPEFSKHFTGIALELVPGARFERIRAVEPVGIRALMGRVVGLRRGLVQLLVLGVASQVCALVAPFYVQWVVDEALVAADRDLVEVLGCGFLLLVFVQAAIGCVRSWVTTVLSTNLNYQWLGNVFAHLMRLPLPWFERRHLGDIVSRFGSIQTIQRTVTTQFVEGVIDGLLVAATLVVMTLYSARLAIVSVGAVAAYALLRWTLYRSLREASGEQIVHAARQQTHFLESARGVQSVRLFGRTEERRVGWMNALADQFNAELRIARLTLSHQTANTLLFSGERVAIVWLAALAVLDHRFSIGMLFAFLAYKDQFTQRVAALVDKVFELRMLGLHGERVADIVGTEAESREVAEIPLERIAPTIEIRGLSFRYADAEPWVLKAFDLVVPAGQCVAITGPSGCGKTTLLKLVLGLIEPTAGEILIGGVPLRRLGVTNARRLIGTVMQDDPLFAGSIADNIAFFDPAPDPRHVEACAVLAAIDAEIVAMPMGYETLVGDIGTGLSGGQKQRILLARALYKNPRMLVLDEATSHLDVWSEQRVNTAIRGLSLTRVLVAHRPETIAMAERVVLLEAGRIVRDFEQAASAAPSGRVAPKEHPTTRDRAPNAG